VRRALALLACVAAAIALLGPRPTPRRVVTLSPGVVELHAEMTVAPFTELRGAPSGSTLRAAPDFRGRALVVATGAGVVLRDFSLDGARSLLEKPSGLPPYDRPFRDFTPDNGVLASRAHGLRIANLRIREVAGFAILVARSNDVSIEGVDVRSCGGRNSKGRNNTTGGILLEEGCARFRVSGCSFIDVLGNGLWTHSLYTSPRNGPGLFTGNRFLRIGRDALQAGHAIALDIVENSGAEVGYPESAVDVEGQAVPVGVDTAGNVERSRYLRNRFEAVNGKCFDLDGFHHGEVRGNLCRDAAYGLVMNNTNPDMRPSGVRIEANQIAHIRYGGVFVIGEDNVVARNRLLDLNTARCEDNCQFTRGEPDLFRSGVYLGKGAERPAPARGNRIEDNEITGYRMAERCVSHSPAVAPDANSVRRNRCAN
jgi:hypothetical protein